MCSMVVAKRAQTKRMEAGVKILVTGGTCNVGGKVVAELLKRGADVRVLARKQPDSTHFCVEVTLMRLVER